MRVDEFEELLGAVGQAQEEVEAELYLDHPKLDHLKRLIDGAYESAGEGRQRLKVSQQMRVLTVQAKLPQKWHIYCRSCKCSRPLQIRVSIVCGLY